MFCYILAFSNISIFFSFGASCFLGATASLHCRKAPLKFFSIIYHLILLVNYFLFKRHTVLFVSWGVIRHPVSFLLHLQRVIVPLVSVTFIFPFQVCSPLSTYLLPTTAECHCHYPPLSDNRGYYPLFIPQV